MKLSSTIWVFSLAMGLTLAGGCGEKASTGLPPTSDNSDTQKGGSGGGGEGSGGESSGPDANSGCTEPMTFTDLKAQVQEFIDYNSAITLSEAQEDIKKAALVPIPAPCCNDNSAYVCCCPCNMAKTIWGLSNHMVANLNCTAEEVGDAVQRWITFINPGGFSGDSCYTGGCERAFSDNGCGGMDETQIVFE